MLDDIEKEIAQESKVLAATWFKDQMLNPYDLYYLYYNPQGYMQLRIDKDKLNENWILATPEHIRRDLPVDYIEGYLCEILRTLPILNDVR